jgi:hypothetical protein
MFRLRFAIGETDYELNELNELSTFTDPCHLAWQVNEFERKGRWRLLHSNSRSGGTSPPGATERRETLSIPIPIAIATPSPDAGYRMPEP